VQDPILTLAFSSNGEQLVAQRADEALFNRIDWPLARLAGLGFDGASLLVGSASLRMLHMAHPAPFQHPALLPPNPVGSTTVEMLVMELINLALSDATSGYVTAIDTLLAHHAAELGETSLPRQWPVIRQEIMRRPAA
jgi:hypothetical protein